MKYAELYRTLRSGAATSEVYARQLWPKHEMCAFLKVSRSLEKSISLIVRILAFRYRHKQP